MSHTFKYKAPMLPENLCAISLSSLWSKLAIMFIAYFTPIAEMVHVMLIFLSLDTISGIWASIKEGRKFQSHLLRKTVMKFLWYTIAVMVAWMMESTFNLGWTKLASITAGFISFVELKSIFENVTRLTNEPVFHRILRLLKRKGSETLDEITGDESQTTDHGKDR